MTVGADVNGIIHVDELKRNDWGEDSERHAG